MSISLLTECKLPVVLYTVEVETMGFPMAQVVKTSPAKTGDAGDSGLFPGL